jgi:hypothetical protein
MKAKGIVRTNRIQYVDYVDGAGIPLFNQICKLDLASAATQNRPFVATFKSGH